jgi:hypothetical protein
LCQTTHLHFRLKRIISESDDCCGVVLDFREFAIATTALRRHYITVKDEIRGAGKMREK